MSADNWTICPRCKHRQETAQEQLGNEVAESYGKIPVEEYLAMRDKFLNPEPLKETLREDWNLGIINDEGKDVFAIHYTCSCNICRFQFEFKHIESLNKPV